ncbi:MAG: hypothetical protein QM770_06035 [Tepidisphaeraceae bacterium]
MSETLPPTPDSTKSETPAPKKRRRWLWITLAAIPVGLFVIAAAAPTVLSTSAGKSMLLPTVAKALAPKGHVEIESWSFGWFSPVRIDGLRITDASGRQMVQGNLQTGLTLWNAVRGNLDLGHTTGTLDVNDSIDPSGKSKLADTLGVYDWPPAKEPAKLPNLAGTADLNLTATVDVPPDPTVRRAGRSGWSKARPSTST